MIHEPLMERVWNLKLQRALENPYLRMRNQRVFCAFNAITDSVVKFEGRAFQKLLKQCEFQKVRAELSGDFSITEISSKEQFFSAFLHCFRRGKALELVSRNGKLFEWFRLNFEEKLRMGGQAGIIANQLAQLEVNTVCYSPILSKPQSRLFNSQHLYYPTFEHGRLVFKKPHASYREGDPTKVNWIFEFKAGDKLRFGNETFSSPRANRLIVASRPAGYMPLFNEGMEQHLQQLSNSFDVFFIGGVQSFQKIMNGRHFRYYLNKLLWQIRQLRTNRKGRFHLEYVAIHEPELDRSIYFSLLPLVDSFGINEVETVHFLKRIGDYHLADQLEGHETPINYYKGIRRIFHKFKLKRLHAHTLGYFLLLLRKDYVGKQMPQEFVNSLLFASRVADARAFFGKPPYYGQLAKLGKLKISETGINAMKNFASEFFGNKDEAKRFLLTGIHDAIDHYLIMVPTAIVKPKATVGLGDTISACAFASEPL